MDDLKSKLLMALFDQKNYSEKVLNLSDFDASLKRALWLIFQWFSLWRSEIKLSMNDENTFFYNQQVSALTEYEYDDDDEKLS